MESVPSRFNFTNTGAGISYANVVNGSKLDPDERSKVAAYRLKVTIEEVLAGCEVDKDIPAYADGCDEDGPKVYVTLKNGLEYGTWEAYKAFDIAMKSFKNRILRDGIVVQGHTLKLHPDMESVDWFTLTPDQVKFK